MSNFDNNPPQAEGLSSPEAPEGEWYQILRDPPIEIDMTQPNRSKDVSMKDVTGFSESKLIATILTPDDRIGVFYTQLPGVEPMIMVEGKDPESPTILIPGKEEDLTNGTEGVNVLGKCIILLDKTGQRLNVYAENPDPDYKISTRVVYGAPSYEEVSDDPEIDREAVYAVQRVISDLPPRHDK